jgi:hypothetical protein
MGNDAKSDIGEEVTARFKYRKRVQGRKNDSKENTLLLAWPGHHPRISCKMHEHMATNTAGLRNYLLGHEKV